MSSPGSSRSGDSIPAVTTAGKRRGQASEVARIERSLLQGTSLAPETGPARLAMHFAQRGGKHGSKIHVRAGRDKRGEPYVFVVGAAEIQQI
jgi:hypothetical protein